MESRKFKNKTKKIIIIITKNRKAGCVKFDSGNEVKIASA